VVAKASPACKIDSTLTVKQRREVDALVRSPGGKLLLTTPGGWPIRSSACSWRGMRGVGVSGLWSTRRMRVDWATISGRYLRCAKALEDVGRPPLLATTATAPPHVATTFCSSSDGGRDHRHHDVHRPNLHYEVIVFGDEGRR